MKNKFLLLFTLSFSLFNAFGQDAHLIDSLTAKLRHGGTNINDTTRVNILHELSKAYWGINPEKGIEYANQCLSLAEQFGYKNGIGDAYNSLGNLYRASGKPMQALDFFKKSLAVKTEMKDLLGIAKANNNIGTVYTSLGNLPESLKYLLIALKTFEAMNDKKGIAASYNNIGNIYGQQKNYPLALKSFLNALKLNEELGNKQWQAYNLGNIAGIYLTQGKNQEALECFLTCGKIAEEIGDKNVLAGSYLNRGEVYYKQNNPKEALKNYLEALKLFTETGEKNGIASCYLNLGDFYINKRNYKEAFEYINKALALSKEISSLDNIKNSYEKFVKLDSSQGNYSRALEHYKLFIATRDSIVNTESTNKTVQMHMQYDFDKKQVADSIKTEAEKKVITAELKQEQTKNYALYGSLALMVLVASVFFKQKNKIGKAKKRSDDLLLNILPFEVAEELKRTGSAKAKSFDNVSVFFTDFVDFTLISEKLTPTELVEEVHNYFTAFDAIIERNGLEKIKTIGDAYLAVCGLPMQDKDHAEKTVQASIEIMDFVNKRELAGGHFKIRIGINSGSVVAGIVGVKKFAYDIWGDTVNTAARMEQSSHNGKINISGSTYKLVKNNYKCEYRGKIEAKNKGEVDMYFVEGKM